MKRPLIFVQDPNALKNWLNACGTDAKVLYDLDDLGNRFDPSSHMVLIQISPSSPIEMIIKIAKQFDVVAFANKPNDLEGLQLFQSGIKGYLNTFSSVERIEQALETINAGSVWLGQSVMQAMIQSLVIHNQSNDDWKLHLTEREQETTELVLQSKSNKQIAQTLEITERTVKAHLHNVFEKLEVSDRLGLVLKIKNWS
ncbi:response regulator transcription factor [Thiomicrorhabdus sp. Milos-T2]|uniref:response regulator transcription factor n=1 Tax=Thiomicrorhabdus sp. Milos-T2 TaxID=90814 RepID=UPI0006920E51|nr:response regulator transcription factor [Thiomicrorhabdus sp. Milos-T2]